MSREHHRWGWAVIGACIAIVVVAAFVWQSAASQPGSEQVTAEPTMSGVPTDQRLSWAPPTLDKPTTITLNDTDGAIDLDPGRDYIIKLPLRPLKVPGGLRIVGGHNVVMIGGEIEVPTADEASDPKLRRALYLKDQTGTIHVEGVHLSGADLSEGIDLDQRAGGTVQLQNILIDTVKGTRAANHADLIQSWAGPTNLRIDGLQGSTTYQGFFLLPGQFGDIVPTSFDIRRVVITSAGADGTAGYLLWTQKDATWLSTRDILLVDSRTDITRLTMPENTWVDGVSLAPDATTAVLPAGEAGVGYRSPGYQGSGS